MIGRTEPISPKAGRMGLNSLNYPLGPLNEIKTAFWMTDAWYPPCGQLSLLQLLPRSEIDCSKVRSQVTIPRPDGGAC